MVNALGSGDGEQMSGVQLMGHRFRLPNAVSASMTFTDG